MIAIYSISQVYATDSLHFKFEEKPKFEFNTTYNFKKNKKDISELIENYNMPSLIEPLILNGLDFYNFIKKYEEIEIYDTKYFNFIIKVNYFNPKVKLLLEINAQ